MDLRARALHLAKLGVDPATTEHERSSAGRALCKLIAANPEIVESTPAPTMGGPETSTIWDDFLASAAAAAQAYVRSKGAGAGEVRETSFGHVRKHPPRPRSPAERAHVRVRKVQR